MKLERAEYILRFSGRKESAGQKKVKKGFLNSVLLWSSCSLGLGIILVWFALCLVYACTMLGLCLGIFIVYFSYPVYLCLFVCPFLRILAFFRTFNSSINNTLDTILYRLFLINFNLTILNYRPRPPRYCECFSYSMIQM